MKTKYIICLGNGPDDIDGEGFDTALEEVQSFRSLASARKEFDGLVHGRTNMRVHLLKVEMVDSKYGRLK